MPSSDPIIRLTPCNDFQVVIWIESSLLSYLPLSVLLAFPPELRVPAKRKEIGVNPVDKIKILSSKFHVNKNLTWPLAMSLGVITVKTDETTFLWHSLPKAVVVEETVTCDTYLGIRVKLGPNTTIEYRTKDDFE